MAALSVDLQDLSWGLVLLKEYPWLSCNITFTVLNSWILLLFLLTTEDIYS